MLHDIIDAAPIANTLEAQQLAVASGIATAATLASSTSGIATAASSPPSNKPRVAITSYPTPMIPRSLQLDATLIDNAFFKLIRDGVLGAMTVEGGNSALVEFDEFNDADDGEEGEGDNANSTSNSGNTRRRHRPEDGLAGSSRSNTATTTNRPRQSLMNSYFNTFMTETLPLWRSRYQDEITLGLRLVLFRLTIGAMNASFGDRAQNIAYRSEHAVRWSAIRTVQRHLGGVMAAAAGGSSSSSLLARSLSRSGTLLYIISFLFSTLPTAVSRKLLSATSPILTVNGLVSGQPLVYQQAYTPTLLQKVLLAVLTVVAPYLLGKLQHLVMRMRTSAMFASFGSSRGAAISSGVEGGYETDGDETEGTTYAATSSAAEEKRQQKRLEWWQDVLQKLERIETIIAVLELANTVVFFAQGRYRSLAERALGLRLVTGAQKTQHFISFAMMNQQLSYPIYFNFVALVMRVLRVGKIASGVGSLGQRVMGFGGSSGGGGASMFGIGGEDDDSGAAADESTVAGAAAAGIPRCGICSRSPMAFPRITECGHTFCYYCIQSRFAAAQPPKEEGDDDEDASGGVRSAEEDLEPISCPRCGVDIDTIRPLPREEVSGGRPTAVGRR